MTQPRRRLRIVLGVEAVLIVGYLISVVTGVRQTGHIGRANLYAPLWYLGFILGLAVLFWSARGILHPGRPLWQDIPAWASLILWTLAPAEVITVGLLVALRLAGVPW